MESSGVNTWIFYIFAVIGATISTVFGSLNEGLSFLLICMVTDYLTGMLVAYYFKCSPKTTTGGASSKIGFQGLLKKGGMLLVVFIAYKLQQISGIAYIRDGAVVAYIINELTSITENLGIMGVPLPPIVIKAIDILKKKEDSKNV